MVTATRYHDISVGHRVHGHETKCRHLHGHNYRIHFTIAGRKRSVDDIGRVIDFSVIKEILCEWLEDNWDHGFLLWEKDPLLETMQQLDPKVIALPFNPTAENMAKYLVEVIGPDLLDHLDVQLVKVVVDETAKCSATYQINEGVNNEL